MIKAGILSIALGLCALLAFQWIGDSIDEQGFLREPFALLPIGSMLLIAGLLAAVIGWLKRKPTAVAVCHADPACPPLQP
jgi:hypothetical protein